MGLVGHFPLPSADTELGAEGWLSTNHQTPAQDVLVALVLLFFPLCTSAAADPPLWGNLDLK